MRYVKLQTVVSKVVDEIIDDVDTIKSILTILKEQELDCSLRLLDGPRFAGVRVNSLDAESFSFRVVQKQSTLLKSAKYNEIEYLEISVKTEEMCRNKPNVSRWSILDPSNDV